MQGKLLVISSGGPSSSVSIYNASTFSLIERVSLPELGSEPYFSPKGNFLITWSHFRKQASNDPDNSHTGNLRVWKLDHTSLDSTSSSVVDGRSSMLNLFTTFTSKNFNENLLQFSSDDHYLFRLLTNEIQVIDTLVDSSGLSASSDATSSSDSIRIAQKGLSRFQIASAISIDEALNVINVASFVPETGGKPAFVTVHRLEYHVGDIGSCRTTNVGGRTMFAASDAKLMWNKSSDALLIHTHCDVDKSNSSYYGSSGLFYCKVDKLGSNFEEGIVPLSKSGAVHDVQWSPSGDVFVVCSG
jgi:uncharacterized protein with WD repeat